MNTGTPAPADLPGALDTAVAALAGARLTSIDWTPPAAWGPTAVRLAFDTGHSVIVDNDATLTGADESGQRISLHHRHATAQLIPILERAVVTDASVESDALTLAFGQHRLAIPAAAPPDRYCAWAIGSGGQDPSWLVCRGPGQFTARRGLFGADVQALADLMACRPGADLEARPEPGVVGILTRHQVIEVLIEARVGRLSGTALWAWAQAMLDHDRIRFESAAAGDLRAALRVLTDPDGIRSTDDLADMIAALGTDPAAARAVRLAWLKFAQSLVLLLLLGALIVAVRR